MPGWPAQTLRTARRASTRALVADLLRRGGLWLTVGAGVGASLAAIDKLAGEPFAWPLAAGAPLVAGAVVAAVVSFMRRWSTLRAASEIDLALGWRNTLTSALEISRSARDDDAFAAWTIGDAEALAPTASLARVAPIALDWKWGAWPVLVAGAVAIGIYLPARHWERAVPRTAFDPASQQRAADQIREIQKAIAPKPDTPASTPAAARELAALDQLQKDLEAGQGDPQQALTRASKTLDDFSESLDREAAAREAANADLAGQLASAATKALEKPAKTSSDKPSSPPMIADKLSKGDLGAAADAARALSEMESTLTPDERARFANELDQLADAIEQSQKAEAAAASKPPESNPSSPTSPPPDAAGQTAARSAPDHSSTSSAASSAPQESRPPEADRGEQPQHTDSEASQAKPRTESPPQSGDATTPPASAADRAKPDAGSPHDAPSDKALQEEERRERQSLVDSMKEAARELKQPPSSVPRPTPSGSPPKPEQPSAAKPSDPNHEQDRRENGSSERKEPASDHAPNTQSPQSPAKEGNPQQSPNGAKEGAAGDRAPQAGTGPAEHQQPAANPAPTGESRESPKSGHEGAKQPQPAPGASGSPQSSPTGATGANGSTGATGASGSSGVVGDSGHSSAEPPQSGGGAEGSTPQRGDQPQGDAGQQKPAGGQSGKEPDDQGHSGSSAAGRGDRTGAGAEDGSRSGSALNKLGKALQRAQDQQQEAQRLHRQAQDSREMAQKMLSPQQQDEIGREAENLARGAGAGSGVRTTPPLGARVTDRADGPTAPVDVRRAAPPGEAPHETTIAEWYSNTHAKPGGVSSAPAEVFQQATQSAEHAIEQQTIPARYQNLIRGVFRRYSEQAPAPTHPD